MFKIIRNSDSAENTVSGIDSKAEITPSINYGESGVIDMSDLLCFQFQTWFRLNIPVKSIVAESKPECDFCIWRPAVRFSLSYFFILFSNTELDNIII